MTGRSDLPRQPPEELEDLSPRLRERLLRLVPLLLELGMGSVHSTEREDDGGRDAEVDCARRMGKCRSVCCSFRFALTRAEAGGGIIRWDPSRPYFIAHDVDGYCTHHDRANGRCGIWKDRPLRCRRYDCRREGDIWEEGPALALRTGAFGHLPGGLPPSGDRDAP